MAVCVFGNNSGTTLAAPISGSATSFSVTSGTGSLFPAPTAGQFAVVTLWSASAPTNTAQMEIIYYTTRSGDTFSGLTRGREGTTPQSFNAGDTCKELLTAGVLGMFQQILGHGVQVFTTTGTWTVPPSVTSAQVEVWGAGGGGGGSQGLSSSASSAGGGGYCLSYLTGLVVGSVYTATVGTGGTGGTGAPTDGTAGSASSFGTITANGGGAGKGASGGLQTSFGAGGVASGGNQLNLNGLPGGTGIIIAAPTSSIISSVGGAAGFGLPPTTYQNTQSALAGNNGPTGCGGNGGTLGGAGGNGGSGLIIVRW